MRGKAMRREPIIKGTSQLPSGPDDGGARHHHHHRAVLADDVDVGPRTEDVVRRAEQLSAYPHRQQAGGEEEDQHPDEVLHADNLVVLGHAEIAHPRACGNDRCRLPAEHLEDRIGEGADADQPSEHAEAHGQHHRDVVVGGVLGKGVVGEDEVAYEPTEEPAPDGADDRPAQVGLQPVRTPGEEPMARRELTGEGRVCGVCRGLSHAAHLPLASSPAI